MTQQPDTITIDKAYELDLAWENGNQPADGLRCVSYRRCGGNTMRTLLCVPGNDDAPTYQQVNGHYQHIAGPTLAEWYAEQDSRDERDTMRDLRQGSVQ